MLRQQAHADSPDRASEASVVTIAAVRLPRNMELAVGTHAPVREVRRAYRQEPVVDGEQFRVQVGISERLGDPVTDRVVETEPMTARGRRPTKLFEVLRLPEPDGQLLLERLRPLIHQ